jgi:predicted Rossmann-fold nucleotide-binding protein
LLNAGGFWDQLPGQLDLMARTGLLTPAGRDLIRQARSAEQALSVLTAAAPPQPEQQITAEER